MAEYESNRSQDEHRTPSDAETSGAQGRQESGRRPDPDEVARQAYRRYEERGRQDGHDLEDWLTAEQEIGKE